ncbi:MAG: PPC domain-containing protein [Gemmataceae bacterium]
MAALAVAIAFAAHAAGQSVGLPTPRLLTVTPMGGKVGTTFEVSVTGEYLDDAGDLLFSDPRVSAKRKLDAAGPPVPDRYVVTVAPDCSPGLVEARVVTRLGVSASRVFAVGTLAEVTPAKPNRSLADAQELPVGSVCNGFVAARATDFYRFTAKRKQRLIIDCASRGIDSKLYATVVVGDEAGRDLVVERRGGVIDFTVPKDGTYTIKVHELTFAGGPAFYYRLGLWELPPGAPVVRQPGTQAVNAFSWPPPGLPPQAAATEVEPNDGGDRVQRITLPCDIAGRFFPAADVDMFEFRAKKGEEWWVEVASERLGHPTDPTVLVQRLVNGAWADVAEFTDVPSPVKVSSNGYAYDGPPYNPGTADGLGKLAIPEDGVYRLSLSDLFGGTRSDPNHAYRLVIRKAAPDFALVAWPLHMELRNGDRNALSKPLALRNGATVAYEVVAFRRDGFAGDIELSLGNLPPGVTAAGLRIPAGKSYGLMLVTAKPDAPRGYANATFVGRATIDGRPVTRPCRVASVAWPVPDSWGEIPAPRLLADVPVSVSGLERAPITLAPKSPVITATTGQKVTVPFAVTRTSDFSGGKLDLRPVGAGFEKAPKLEVPLTADRAAVTLDLKALNLTTPGEYRLAFLGGGVVKYRHRPDLAAAAEEAAKTRAAEVKSLEEQLKAAPANAKPAMTAKMKAAADALTATKQRMEKAKAAALPQDIADIVVSEPVTIRVLPGGTK